MNEDANMEARRKPTKHHNRNRKHKHTPKSQRLPSPSIVTPTNQIVYSDPQVQMTALKKHSLYPDPDTKHFVEVFNQLNTRKNVLEMEATSTPKMSNKRLEGEPENKELETKKTELAVTKADIEIFLVIARNAVLNIKKTGGRPAELREIIEFARIEDQEFNKFLLSRLIEKQEFNNSTYLQTLKLVILTLDVKFYVNNIDTLLKIAKKLGTIIETTHQNAQSFHDIINAIEALYVTWLALSLGSLKVANQDLWNDQTELFKKLSDNSFQPLAYRAKLMLQALTRIDVDKDPAWKENCIRGYKILSGLVTIATSLKSADLGGAASGALTVWESVKTTSIPKREWFMHIIILEAELGNASATPENFNAFTAHLSRVIKQAKRELDLSYGIFELVQRIALNSSINRGVRCLAIDLLQQMYIEKDAWHADIHVLKFQGEGNGDNVLRKEILRTLNALTQDVHVQTYAKGGLESLTATFKSKRKSTGNNIILEFIASSKNNPEDIGLMNILMQQDILRIPLSNQLLGHFTSQLTAGSNTPDSTSTEPSDSSMDSPTHTLNKPAEEKEIKKSPIHKIHMMQTIPQMTLYSMPRDRYTSWIEGRFATEAANGRKPIVVIQGVPGIGKTQLAINYMDIHKNKKEFVFWVDAKDLKKQWIALGETLFGAASQLGTYTPENQLAAIREELTRYPEWLIVIDDIGSEEELRELLPDHLTEKQQVLMTTRNPDWPGYCQIELKPFSPEEVKNYFQTMDVNPFYLEGMEELARELEYIPLALYYAITYMKLYRVTALACKNEYLEKGIELFAMIKANKANKAHYHDDISDTYKAILVELNQEHSDAVNLLICCSYLNYQNIETRFLKRILGFEDQQLQENIMILRSYSVLSIIDQTNVQMYKLSQIAIRYCHADQLTPKELQAYFGMLTKQFCKIYPINKNDVDDFTKARLLIPHIESLIEILMPLAKESDEPTDSIGAYLIKLYMLVYDYHRTVTGNYSSANLVGKKIYFIHTTINQHSNAMLAEANHVVGITYNELGYPTQAIKCHQEALEQLKRVYGEHPHPSIAECYADLGNAYFHIQDYKQSEIHYASALTHYKKCVNPAPLSVASCQLYLARTKIQNPKNALKAIELCNQALTCYERYYFPGHPMFAEIDSNLSDAYMQLSSITKKAENQKKALDHTLSALRIRVDRYGFATHWVAESYMQLAIILVEQNKLKEAEKSYRRALNIYLAENQQKPYLCVAKCYKKLAELYQKMDKPQEERTQLEAMLPIYARYNKDADARDTQSRIDALSVRTSEPEKPGYLRRLSSVESFSVEEKIDSMLSAFLTPGSPPLANRSFHLRNRSSGTGSGMMAAPANISTTVTQTTTTTQTTANIMSSTGSTAMQRSNDRSEREREHKQTSTSPTSSTGFSPLSRPRRATTGTASASVVGVFSTTTTSQASAPKKSEASSSSSSQRKFGGGSSTTGPV